MDRRGRRRGARLAIGIGVILLVVAWWLRPPSMDDPVTTTGRVSANEGERRKEKTPIISFEAGERTYTFDPSFSTYPPIPVGNEVEVRYERNDPSVARYVRWETEWGWLIALSIGGALIAIGLAMWFKPDSVASRADAAGAATPLGPPPGWYADPDGEGRRWWDGSSWTDRSD